MSEMCRRFRLIQDAAANVHSTLWMRLTGACNDFRNQYRKYSRALYRKWQINALKIHDYP